MMERKTETDMYLLAPRSELHPRRDHDYDNDDDDDDEYFRFFHHRHHQR